MLCESENGKQWSKIHPYESSNEEGATWLAG